MLGRVDLDFSRTEFNENLVKNTGKNKVEYKSLFDIVERNRETGMVVWEPSDEERDEGFQNEVSYLRDMRFDYVNGRVFLPVYIYKYKEVEERDFRHNKALKELYGGSFVAHSQILREFEIWNAKEEYVVESLKVLKRGLLGVSIKEVDLKELPIREGVVEEDLDVLFYKYIKSAYADRVLDFFDYKNSRYTYLSSTEKRLLKKHGLEWYGGYKDIDYSELRSYPLSDLDGKFSEDELGMTESFRKRLQDFESYLLSHLAEGVYWTGDFKGNFKALQRGKIFFVKYKKSGIPLFIKSKWVQNCLVDKE